MQMDVKGAPVERNLVSKKQKSSVEAIASP
jgi:hypothetical protein